MPASRPLDSFPLIETRDLDQMRASLARIYAEPVVELVGRERALRVVINHCALRHIGLNYASYGADVLFRYPASNYIGQIFPIAGKADVVTNGAAVVIDHDHSVLFSADSDFTMTCTAAYERLFLTLDPSALADKLTALTGVPIGSRLKMNPAQDLTHPLAQILRRHFTFLVDRLSAGESMPSLVLTEFEQTLMVMFLHANHHNYSYLLGYDPPDVALSQVRRAEEYLEANWSRPLSVEELAAAAGVSIRSLAADFKRSRGYSPTEFLMRVRLQRAREMLRSARPDVTVAEVASACGFASRSRFSRAYRKAFGEHPYETLVQEIGRHATRH